MFFYSVEFRIELNSFVISLYSLAARKKISTHLCSSYLFLFPELPLDLSADLDSDHDYETINETFVSVVKKAQEDVMFY